MTSNQSKDTVPGARAGVIKLGLDVHASLIVVVRQVDGQASQPPQRFNEEAFIGFVHRQLAAAESVHSCYEAGPFGYVLHRRLTALGVHNLVVRPRDWSTYGIWQRVLLSIDAELQALTIQLQQAAPVGVPVGLGAMTWELLTREVGDWHRFSNRRQVASYTGLCPSEHSSGRSRIQGSITRHGNPRVRHLLIEAVWRLCKFQPQYRGIAKWHDALTAIHLSSARKKKIIVAIGRQLAIDLWRLATARTTAAALGLQTS